MVSITFTNKDDFQFVFDQLNKFIKIGDSVIVNEEELSLSVAIGPYDTKLCYQISQCIANCVSTFYEKRWMEQLLTSTYYYQDKDEIGEITSIARSIGDGDKEDYPGAHRYANRRDVLLQSTLSCIEQGGTILFDSFLRFRTGPYRALLNELIGEAIDEYKLEQEYQNFVEGLRILLRSRQPLQKKVVLVYDKTYQLYDMNGSLLTGIEGKLEDLPVGLTIDEIDSEILFPLLLLAPEEVCIYTDDSDEGLVQTIRNVFEERLSFFSYRMSKLFFSGNP
ncbi:putative sporulation protein YtxC [Guptibacillus hwajinpoensis]|uniref:putative sporulation protein YtxC n=1 Tax=Guptibacillus hwajinpoensis TaxID=208199 RepID=UPI00384EE58F